MKFVGHLSSALRKYHSGWQYPYYVVEAKHQYTLEVGAPYKHEDVHNVVKSYPKFMVAEENMDTRTARALGLDRVSMLDADTLPVVEKATRPTAGKKKAKRMKHTNDKSDNNMEMALNRIAVASEKKNKLLHDGLLLRMFERDPESPAAIAFSKPKRTHT
jgi:hypothetical protein